jgi:hypothetical protein
MAAAILGAFRTALIWLSLIEAMYEYAKGGNRGLIHFIRTFASDQGSPHHSET